MATLVRELMRRGLITCPRSTSLGEAAALLTQHRVHALIVVERDGTAIGLLSDFDLLAGEWLSGDAESLAAMRAMTAGELMSSPLDTIDAGQGLKAAAEEMRRQGVHRLVVTEGGRPVGVVSMSDFVGHLAEREPLRRATVEDVMSVAMLICRDDAPAIEVARGLTDSRFRSVVVLNGAGRLRGMISGFDFVGCIDGEDCSARTAADLMHAASIVERTATLQRAAQQMIEAHLHRLVVVDPDDPAGLPLGIISSYDIVHEMGRPGSAWRA